MAHAPAMPAIDPAEDSVSIRDVRPSEAEALGRLMVDVYSQLEGFPTPEQQPGYYAMLADIASQAAKKGARVLVAKTVVDGLLGGVVYFGDMSQYGSGGIATQLRDAAGIRLLGVAPEARGKGVGKALTRFCIELARSAGMRNVVLHTTYAMQTAWRMYEGLGFKRARELDFVQGEMPVFGFRLQLQGGQS